MEVPKGDSSSQGTDEKAHIHEDGHSGAKWGQEEELAAVLQGQETTLGPGGSGRMEEAGFTWNHRPCWWAPG